ncbi:MAG: DMT family transporter [Burkholderiales bacterium]|nr:DMT family transporter [Burkholderiales bacterium]
MTRARTLLLTALAMLAFAGNSLLCRMALATTTIDPASFTAIRIVAGALALAMIVRLRHAGTPLGDWPSGIALFVYAAAFSFAYVTLPAAAGALLLFGSVQATMIGHGLASGERPGVRQLVGLAVAFAGLVGLLLPGLSAPPLQGSLLMIAAGAAWGIYSLRGRSGGDATRETAGNFLRASVLAGGLGLLMLPEASVDRAGVLYAVASGALASGVGYAVWYTALRGLAATSAASVQLSVPVIAAVGGILLLGEALTLRLVLCSTAVLGGIGLVIAAGQRRARDARRGRPG